MLPRVVQALCRSGIYLGPSTSFCSLQLPRHDHCDRRHPSPAMSSAPSVPARRISFTTGTVSATAEVHPSFADDDADTILCSQDDVLFHTHSLVLKLGSGWFRTLFSLPQGNCDANSVAVPPRPTEPLRVSEPSVVLADLLRIMMPTNEQLPPLDDLEHVFQLLLAAEKYEMTGAISLLRLAMSAPPLLNSAPIRVYSLACRYGMLDLAQLASSKTIGLDLLSPDVLPQLNSIDPPHLAQLLLLHRRRRDALRRELDSTVFYANNVPGRCSRCQGPAAHTEWLRLKAAWIAAIEQTPEEVASLDILHSQGVRDLVNITCTLCKVSLYNGQATIQNLKRILQELPTMVEVCVP